MWRAFAWLWGLVPLAALVAVALSTRGPGMEADIAARAATALADAGQGWARVTVAGRDVTVSGDAPTEERRRRATAVAASPDGVRTVVSTAGVLPSQSPFTLTLERRANAMNLSGFAPDGEVADRLMVAFRAAFPGLPVNGSLRLAGGLRDESAWLGAITYGIAQLRRMSEGRIAISDLNLSIEGRAADLDAFGAIRAALRDPPRSVTIARSSVVPPVVTPYVWTATVGGGRIILGGHVPTDEVRAANLERAERLGAVSDETRPADGAPPSFSVLTAFILDQLARLDDGRATISDTAVTIEGRARTPQSYADFTNALSRAPGGTRVNVANVQPAAAAPFTWSVAFDGAGVTFSGHVPDAQARAVLLEQATRLFAGRPVVDRTLIAAGAPGNVRDLMSFALGQMPFFARGEARLTDTVLSFEGTAASPDAFQALFSPRTVPNGVAVSSRITPATVSPYSTQLAWNGRGLTVTGFVPGPAGRSALTGALGVIYPGVPVEDQSRIAIGSPLGDGWAGAMSFAAERLSRLAQGRAVLLDATLTLTGEANTSTTRDALAAELAALPPNVVAGAHAITVPPPPVTAPPARGSDPCQAVLDEAASAGRILFETGSAAIGDGSEAKLRAVAQALERCPGARVEIGGHTDATGDRLANLDLSKRRAEAVRDWLARVGIDRDRLLVAGYGPDAPVGPNDTDEGRGQNRRIDFIVRP